MSLLMTGATGLVGRMLLEHAREQPVLAVARRAMPRSPNVKPNVKMVQGDLCDPTFSLAAYQNDVTEIIHCAAAVRFDLSLADARAINTHATGRLLDFARRAPRLRKFTHVSTVYVMGNDEGTLPEAPYQARSYPNTYEQSKAEAETLVLAAAKDLPVQIVRLSSIAGNARTGVVTQFNHVHQLLKLFPRRILPVAPGHADIPVDLIAEDWTVPSLWHLHQKTFAAGSVAHLSAGPGAAIRLADLFAICAEVYECPPPKLIPLAEFDRFMHSRLGGLLMAALGLFLPHLGRDQSFLNAQTLARIAAPPPTVESFLPAIVRYCHVGERELVAR